MKVENENNENEVIMSVERGDAERVTMMLMMTVTMK
jgi:hypothetical protein